MGTYLGKTGANSNPVTGEWHGGKARLDRMGIPYIVLERIETRHRKKPNAEPIPTRLHRNEVEGHLGGAAFSSAMLRYLDGKEAKQPAPSLNYAEKHWWAGEHAEREMRAYFPADIVDVVLGVFRDGMAWDMAMQRTARGYPEVKVAMRQMKNHCRAVIRQQRQAAA